MQTSPQTPTPPAETPAPAVTITAPGVDGKPITLTVPRTAGEVQELQRSRDELSDQLVNVTARRRELSDEIRTAPEGASRTGLEDRLRILDQRIIQLETDLASTGRQISAAPASLVGGSEVVHIQSGDDFEEGVFAGGFFSLLGLAVLYGIARFWRRRRGGGKRTKTPLPTESSQRLERLEQGMESIAIEIERVSEGQRFVTKLLSEQPPSLKSANRVAQPVAVEQEESSGR